MTTRTGQRGSVTLWLLGLGLCLLVLGGLGIDLWTAVTVRARLAGLAEAVATAAASGVSEQHWRQAGTIRLDPSRADALGMSLISTHPAASLLDGTPVIAVGADGRSVGVEVRGSAPLTLLRLVSGSDRIEIVVSSHSRPHVVP